MLKRSTLFVALLLAVAMAPAVLAQTSYDIKNGTVISVGDKFIVIREASGQTREFDVPADFKVNIDGRDVAWQDLKPGMKITATIKTVTVPVVVQTKQLKDAKVIKNAGGLLYVREADGIHSYNVPSGFRFDIGGAKLRLEDLQVGQVLNATIVHTATGTTTEQELANASASDAAAKAAAEKAAADKAAAERAAAKAAADKAAADAAAKAAADKAAADAAAKAAADKAAADAAAAAAAAKKLPKTASSVPLAGALGVLCVGLGAALTLRRKLS
jgi:LPXTG-motif cell wall-anchored protein